VKHAFSPDGESALRSRISTDTLIALDYDGTLSPLVTQPHRARTASGVVRALRMLNEIAQVAIMTGRRTSDVRKRLEISPTFLVGNHGLEGLGEKPSVEREALELTRTWLNQLEGGGSIESAVPGVFVEDKGLSISVHYRLTRDRARARETILERMASLNPAPRLVGGHYVISLLPAFAPDKGDALLKLVNVSGCRNAMFIGDDETDEAAFKVAGRESLTIRVGYKSDSSAHYFVQNQAEVGPLLYRLVAAIQIASRVGLQEAVMRVKR
jgi:trehalose 6-phosphate phosphatase